jgi:uncharacterized membrane protein
MANKLARIAWAVLFGVICCLGLSMILLAAFVHLPRYLVMAVALLTIATHDLFDGLKPASFHAHQWLLFVLHRSGRAHIGEIFVFVLFPFIPWCAVTLLGFAMGPLFESNSASARRTLLSAGAGALALFAALRATNAYGNPNTSIAHSTPGDWHALSILSKSIILFFDVEKYPPSLQYLLMTLGPILILLAIGGARFGVGSAGSSRPMDGFRSSFTFCICTSSTWPPPFSASSRTSP